MTVVLVQCHSKTSEKKVVVTYFLWKKVGNAPSRQLDCPKEGAQTGKLQFSNMLIWKKTCKRLSAKTAGYFTDIGSWKTIKLLSFHLSKLVWLINSFVVLCQGKTYPCKHRYNCLKESSRGKVWWHKLLVFVQWGGSSLNAALGYASSSPYKRQSRRRQREMIEGERVVLSWNEEGSNWIWGKHI